MIALRRLQSSDGRRQLDRPLHWLQAWVTVPPARFSRVRRALMLLDLILALMLFYLMQGRATEQLGMATLACALLVWLGCLWVYAYSRISLSPLWDVGVALSLLAVGLSIHDPLSPSGLIYLSLLYGGLCYRSFTLSTGTVVSAVILYSMVHIVSLGYTMSSLLDASNPLIGLLQVPGLSVSAAAMHILARLLAARQQTSAAPLSDLEALIQETDLNETSVFDATLNAVSRIIGEAYRDDIRLLIGTEHLMAVVAGGRPARLDIDSALSRAAQSLRTGELVHSTPAGWPLLASRLGLSPATSAVYLTPLMVREALSGLIVVGTDVPLHPATVDGLRAIAGQTSMMLETLDVTASLRQREAGFRALIQTSSDLILVISLDLTIVDLAPTAGRVLGYDIEQLLGTPFANLIHPDDVADAQAAIAEIAAAADTSAPVQWRLRRSDGSWIHVETVGNNLLRDPNVAGIVLTARDISERKALENSILHQVLHDPLTDLPNRTMFMDRLDAALESSYDREPALGVLFLDLDRFKVVNDSLGHDAGNQLLIQIAQRLRESVRPGDTVARLSGDEFAVLVDDITTEQPAIDIAERILYRLREPFRIDGYEVVISCSIGVALGPVTGGSTSDILRNADLAMYESKSQRRASYTVFDPRMNARAVNRLKLETELRSAVANSQFEVYYQPLVQLQTGKVVEVEALVRWQHPVRGLLLPDTFISLAEETGLIEPIGLWVLEEASRQAQQWERDRPGAPPLNLNVNISVRQFQQPRLVSDVARVLRQTKIDPRQLTLEITESVAFEDAEAAVATMLELKKLGIQLAIDDFGTGYSALSYLKRFPVDALKIDRSFIEGLNYDHGDVAIVRAVIAFAKTMSLSVTAEGVETPDQLRQLRMLGCDRGQGFYFATPLPGVELALDSRYGTGRLSLIDPPALKTVRSLHQSA